jgi:hypothetical protein
MVTKNEGVGKETINQILSGIVAIGGYFKFECVRNFLVKLLISISACYSFLNRRCQDEWAKRGQNVPPSYNCANSICGAN